MCVCVCVSVWVCIPIYIYIYIYIQVIQIPSTAHANVYRVNKCVCCLCIWNVWGSVNKQKYQPQTLTALAYSKNTACFIIHISMCRDVTLQVAFKLKQVSLCILIHDNIYVTKVACHKQIQILFQSQRDNDRLPCQGTEI